MRDIVMKKKCEGQICPEVHYRKTEKGIVITGCYGTDGQIVLPDEIDGMAVKGIGDYAFADNREEEGKSLVWKAGDVFRDSTNVRISGGMVTQIGLPAQVTEIGRYAFYRCKNLKKLALTDSLLEIGGGAFAGCSLAEVEIHFLRGEQSCLKSVLDEMRFAIRAELRYSLGEDVEEKAQLLFPEHYEEAVENTPARILFTQHHGAGGYYRQCFYDRKLDYRKYDDLFPYAQALEQPETAAGLALGRLRNPFRLTQGARREYETYVREHLCDVMEELIMQADLEGLGFLSAGGFFTEEALDYGIAKAAQEKETEILSRLMDEKHRRYPKKKKNFCL